MPRRTLISYSAEQTQHLGKQIASNLQGGETIALFGELGSGKTTFVQGIAAGLGITKKIISPTFILVRNYPFQKNKKTLQHVDLYRLESSSQLKSISLNDLTEDKRNIIVIEWAEKAKNLLPKKTKNIFFINKGKNIRQITLQDI